MSELTLRGVQADGGIGAAYAAAADQLRVLDPDRYAACLFVPPAARAPLVALYAFSAEIARIRDQISEPMTGEIRHQWWRETLSCTTNASDARRHPIAAALKDVLARYRLPPEPLVALIEARGFDLYDDPMPTWLDLEGYCGETSSALIRLASLILAGGRECGAAGLCGHAGVAYAITGLLRAFPIHARRRQCYIPHEVLIACAVTPEEIFEGRDGEGLRAALAAMRARAREHLGLFRRYQSEIAPAIRPAFLPAVLVEPYLARMERRDYRPYESRVEMSPLRRLFQLQKAAWTWR